MSEYSIQADVAGSAQNRADASTFIAALVGTTETAATFQTFPEGGPSDYGPRILHGRLDEVHDDLVRLNDAGHGIFVMVNEGDGNGRKGENVVALRALFTDDDGGSVARPSTDVAQPSIVVQSAHGQHTYWLLQPGEALAAFTPAQAALAAHFGTDPKVKDLPRVMRVPGFFHQKDRSAPFLVKLLDVRQVRYRVRDVVAAFPSAVAAANEPTRPSASRTAAPPAGSTPVSTSMAVRRARAYLAKVAGAVQDDHGDDTTYRVACMLIRDFALPHSEALALFKEWNLTCTPPWPEDDLVAKLDRAEKYGTGAYGAKLTEDPQEFKGTEDLCYVVPLGSYYLRLPTGQWDLGAPLDKNAATKHLRSRGLSEKAIKNIMAYDLLPLAHGIDCAPGEGPVFSRDERLVINTYRPSRIVPKAGAFPRIEAIVRGVTDGDDAAYEWLLNWMAFAYQNPASRSMTAPVFQGQQGWGKTVLGLMLGALIGEDNTTCISQKDLDGQFNGHFVTKLFVIADEVVNQESIRDSESILKKYITDSPLIVNVKNTPQFQVVNRMSWWFTSNKTTPVKVEGRGDRRYAVFAALKPVPENHKRMLRAMFTHDRRFTDETEQEVAAFGAALLAHNVDLAAAMTPLQNAAREALINAGRNSAELFLGEAQEHGVEAVVREHYVRGDVARWEFDGDYAVDAVYGAYTNFCTDAGMRALGREKFGAEMRMVFPEMQKAKATDPARKKRVAVYRGLPKVGTSSNT